MSNVIPLFRTPDASPGINWVKAYRTVYLAIGDNGHDPMASEIYHGSPDFRAEHGESVTSADYEQAFRDLDVANQKTALIFLCDSDPALAVDVIVALDPFGGITGGQLPPREESVRVVIEAIKVMRAGDLFLSPDPFFGVVRDLKHAISLTM